MSISHLNFKQLEESIEILIKRIKRVIKREQWVKLCNLQNQLTVLYDILDKLEQKEEDEEDKNSVHIETATVEAEEHATVVE